MNREQFMNELKDRLRLLPTEEYSSAISYYEEYFDDAGVENEVEVIKKLGSPSQIAAQLISEFGIKETVKKEVPVKKKVSTFWIVVLAILASPIALPLSLAFLAIIFAFGIVVFSLLIVLGAVGFAAVVSCIAFLIVSFFTLFVHFPTGIFFIGTTLIAFGISTFLIAGVLKLSKAVLQGLTKVTSKFLSRGTKHENY